MAYFLPYIFGFTSFICADGEKIPSKVDRERNLACKLPLDISGRSSVESSKGVLVDKDKVQELCIRASFFDIRDRRNVDRDFGSNFGNKVT